MKKYLSAKEILLTKGALISSLVVAICFANSVYAQGDGPRFYWKGLMGTNAVPVIGSSLGGNANPFDPTFKVMPGADFKASMAMVGYAKMLPMKKRAAMVSIVVPMGRISSDIILNGRSYKNTARGYGDPMLQFGINVIGPKANMGIPDMLRYKPKFSVDLIGSLAIPIGAYNDSTPINIGQNRWYGRIGAPVVWQIGTWYPGKRTTLEFLPSIWLFGPNNDFVGKKMETKPICQLEGHLTRDFTAHFWGSFDVVSYSGGKATIDNKEGNALSNLGLGATLGYQINENIELHLSYSSTINDKNPEDLKIDGFRVTFLYGWHPLVEGMKRLKNGE